jgi:protein gp37
MAETSKIEWCDSTFNPWIGCTKIAPACDHCYAADMSKRYGWAEWGNHPRKRTSAGLWDGVRKWQRLAPAFLAEHGRRRRVFCASLADVFDNQVPAEWRGDLWALIRDCPDINFLMLTKRPQNIGTMLPAFWDEVKGHIWLGTTVEDQKHAEQNIPHLIKHDAAVRFLSIEPMLGPITFRWAKWDNWRNGDGTARSVVDEYDGLRMLDWIIAGGESGPHARTSNPEWFTKLRDQCAAAGVPFLFKQWGEWVGEDRPGKKAAGRVLDGITHDGFPLAA